MSTRKITFILAAALSLLVIAGTKVSQLTRTRSLQETSRFLVSTQDATTGRWSSRYITAPDFATNISQWQTNITGSGGSVDPTNAVLANIISTGAVTNKPNSWLIYTGTGSTTNAYFAENRATSTFLYSNDFSGLLQNVVNRMGDGASIRVAGNPYYTNAYVFSNMVTITNFFIMEGEGNPVTVFRGASTLNGPIIQLGSQSTVGVGGIGRINRVRFEGDSMGTNGVGVDVIKCAEPVFEFCEFTGFKRAGIEMSSTNYVHWAYAQECWFVMKWASSKGILIDASPIEGADIDQNHFIVNGGLFGVFGGGAAIVQSNWFPGLTIRDAHFRYSIGSASDVIQVYAGQDITIQNCEFQNFGSIYPVFLADRGSTTNYNVRLIGNAIKSTALGTGPDYLAYVGTFITNVSEVGNSGYAVESLGLAGDNGTVRSGVNADYITEGTLPNGRIPYALTNNYAALATFNAAVSNSSGGFWSTDVSGFISYSSPNDYMVFAHPQGGIFNTLDNWVLGDANSTKTILSLSTNKSIVESNLWVKGTNFARQVKLVGGQAASSLLRLDSNTNLAVATIGSGVSFDGTTLTGTGQGANAVLSNLVGTVANNVTNENSSALQINTGTLTLTPGILSNIVAQGFGTPYIAVSTNGGTVTFATNLQFRGLVISNDSTGIFSIHAPASSSGSGGTNPVVLAAGFLVNSNLAFQSITNLGTNDVKGWDLFAHRRARMGVFGNTTLVLTNMSSVTNAAGGGLAVPYEADIYVQASGFTFTLASLHPVIGAVHLTGGVTNRMMLDWNGTNWLVRFSDVPTSGNGAYALTNAPTITSATLTLASFSTNTIDSLTDDAPKGRWRLMAHDLDTASLKDIAINQFPGSSMGEVSVLDFGADRTGASDSTVAFQAALTNPAVYIPPGTYVLTNVIVTNATVRGIAGKSILRFNTNAVPSGYMFDTAANLTHWRGVTFDGGCTTNLKTFSTSDEQRSGIKLYIGGSATIGDCQFVNWHSNAVYASGINDTTGRPNHFRFFNNTVSNSWAGLWLPAPNLGEYSVVTGNKFLLCYRGLRNDNANVTVTGNTMVDCSYGIYGYDATAGRSHSVYSGNTIHHSGIGFQNALTGINLDGNNMLGSPTIELFAPSFGISFRGNYFESPTFSDYSGGTNYIIGNSVFGSISQSGTSTSVYRNNVGALTGIPISETVALGYTTTNIHIRPFRGDTFSVILTNNAGFTIESGGEAQRIKLRLTQDGTGSRTVVFTNTIRFSTTYPTPTLSTGVGKTDWIELQYWSASNRWDVINIGLGN